MICKYICDEDHDVDRCTLAHRSGQWSPNKCRYGNGCLYKEGDCTYVHPTEMQHQAFNRLIKPGIKRRVVKSLTDFERVDGRLLIPKREVPLGLKIQVWDQHIGLKNGIGKCYCCRGRVIQMRWELAHVKARVNGGEYEKDNLRVCCHDCNYSMGTEDLEEWKSSRFPLTV
jgi:hypothetical protein